MACPYCSFDPTSSGDFCDKHRPGKKSGTPWECMIPKDEVFKGYINLSNGAVIMGEFVHASLARLFAQEIERLAAKVATLEERHEG